MGEPRCRFWRLTLLGLLFVSGSVLGTFSELGQEDIRGTDAGAVGGRALCGDNGVCQADSLYSRMVRWQQFPAHQSETARTDETGTSPAWAVAASSTAEAKRPFILLCSLDYVLMVGSRGYVGRVKREEDLSKACNE